MCLFNLHDMYIYIYHIRDMACILYTGVVCWEMNVGKIVTKPCVFSVKYGGSGFPVSIFP